MSLLEGDFDLGSGKPACLCSMAQLGFLCRQVVGDSKEWGMATCCCGGEEWGQMKDMRHGEKLVRENAESSSSRSSSFDIFSRENTLILMNLLVSVS